MPTISDIFDVSTRVHQGDFVLRPAEGVTRPAEAQKLDTVREALRQGDLKRASQLARVFKLTPVTV
jgi:hypothetical protein